MPGIDERDARAVLGPSARFLASGATCVAFTDGRRVVRLAALNGREATRLNVDAAIRTALRSSGVPTPEALEVGLLPSGRAFTVDTLAGGDGSGPSPAGWADLGGALAVLHALPHRGYGLLEDRADAFQGLASTPASGLRTRLEEAWPFGETDLKAHPLVAAAPDLAGPLAGLEGDLRDVIGGRTALCHTDLHGEQFRWREGRLAALPDFGDAAIGPPAWDVASLAYFHGWSVAEEVARAAALPCGREAALFGLLLAFHRASRAVTLRHPARTTEAVAFARGCLARLAGRRFSPHERPANRA
ncbi:phosphotransferase family protein [Deinococcus apachensis]|uniref:phosphotransferase family protein n=1 Tax=Deinococcus apachensis TaxID=309886 RepID=UPI00035FDE38|nr:aminoglycoside phosphotransferase family protein [Deinococcus apachensis]